MLEQFSNILLHVQSLKTMSDNLATSSVIFRLTRYSDGDGSLRFIDRASLVDMEAE